MQHIIDLAEQIDSTLRSEFGNPQNLDHSTFLLCSCLQSLSYVAQHDRAAIEALTKRLDALEAKGDRPSNEEILSSDFSQQNLLQQRLIKIHGLMTEVKTLRSKLDALHIELNDVVQESKFPTEDCTVIVPELLSKGVIAKFSDGSLDFVPSLASAEKG